MASQLLDINKIKLLKKKFENRRQRLLKQRGRQLNSTELSELQKRKQTKMASDDIYDESVTHLKKLTNINEDQKTLKEIQSINAKSKESPTVISSTSLNKEIETLKNIISTHAENINSTNGILYEESILSPNVALDLTEIKESQEKVEIAIAQTVLSSNILEEALKRIEFLSKLASDNKDSTMKQELLAIQPLVSTLEKSLHTADSVIQQSRQISSERDETTEDSVKSKKQEIQQLLDKIENYQEDLEDIFNKAKEKLKTDNNRKNLVKKFFESSQNHLARIHTLLESETFGQDQTSLKNLETLLKRANEDIIRTGKELTALSPDKSIRTMIEKWITKFIRLVEDIAFTFSLPNISKEGRHQADQERKTIKDAMASGENDNPQQTFTQAFKGKVKSLKKAGTHLAIEQGELEKPKPFKNK